jgi:hypothetical protein
MINYMKQIMMNQCLRLLYYPINTCFAKEKNNISPIYELDSREHTYLEQT